jgi:D-erythritol 1-phosphate dehydrogenase
MRGDWTAVAALPGGDVPFANFEAFVAELKRQHEWLLPDVAAHYARLYGTRAAAVLGGATSMAGLGTHIGGRLYEAEIDYLRQHEWAVSAEDILDRRTKHGLHLGKEQKAAVARLFQ